MAGLTVFARTALGGGRLKIGWKGRLEIHAMISFLYTDGEMNSMVRAENLNFKSPSKTNVNQKIYQSKHVI